MKKYFLIALLAILFPIVALAQTTTWKSDPLHSRLGFSVKHLSIAKVQGFFSDFETEATFSKADYSDLEVKVLVEVASINTGVEARDNHLKSADFFDVEQHPKMIFVSTSVEKVDEKYGKLYGDLTFHGVTKPVVFEVAYNGTVTNPMNQNETAGFRITGTIDRKDFNMGMGFADNFISDKVDIIVDAEFSPVIKPAIIEYIPVE